MSQDGVVFAKLLDGKGGARDIDPATWTPDDGVLWLHLDHRGESAMDWLERTVEIGESSREALLEESPRPRAVLRGAALLVALRGANLNPGEDVVDMVSLRLWVARDRVISLRHRRVRAPQEVADELGRGEGPTCSGGVLARVCEELTEHIGRVVDGVEDQVDALEDEALVEERAELHARVIEVRRDAIALRRYVAPQRDLWTPTLLDRVDWLAQDDRYHLREVGQRLARAVETVDAVRERAALVQDVVDGRAAEQVNRNIYVMSLVAAVFLPLGLLTGLLGINVGGMPGVESDVAFWIVCAILLVTAGFELLLLRRLRWV